MAETKTESKAEAAPGKSGRRFVILHSQVGHRHMRGDVASAEDLGGEAGMERLLSVGAVREANADERDLQKVTLLSDTTVEPAQVASHEQRVADLRRELERKQGELVEAQDALNRERVKESVRPPTEVPKAITEVIAQKDKQIRDLQNENNKLKAQLADAGAVKGGAK